MFKKVFAAATALVFALALNLSGCSSSSDGNATGDDGVPSIVVTTSLIESAVSELASEDFRIVRLVPPHSCPGHFDVSPSQLESISRASLFIRHDYQAHLDRKISDAGKAAGRTLVIPSRSAQTIPDNYLEVCRLVCVAMGELKPERTRELDARYSRLEGNLKELEQRLLEKYRADLNGRCVAVSTLQEGFCRWIGLDIAATFDNADQSSLKSVEETVTLARSRKAEAVVANLQRERREADALAEKLNLPVIVLSNFPEVEGDSAGYSGLLESNILALYRVLVGNE